MGRILKREKDALGQNSLKNYFVNFPLGCSQTQIVTIPIPFVTLFNAIFSYVLLTKIL